METINQAAAAVRATIWGEDPATSDAATTTHSDIHKSMIDDTVTERRFSGRLESDPDAEGAYQPGDTDKRPQGPTSTGGKPQGANVTGDTLGTNKNTFSSSNEPNTGFGGAGAGAEPSVAAAPSSPPHPTQKHQGSDIPTAAPDPSPPLSNKTTSSTSSFSGMSGPGKLGGPGAMKLPDSENQSKSEGTGTLYERSTGLASDGGDFDATRPGAAREAARLMDDKGLRHGDVDGQPSDPPKEKKWYGVDHSGFGGHGSHKNKRRSSDAKSESDRELEAEEQVADDNVHAVPQKKGITQKIKDKLHHSSSK
ncbi:hypothetical protein DRE_02258 [Drechslerella stenobrocha 248]|uniref:Uncharacterized protein n=1 Tax=Drechslerella stenobrocha 248 TaxID=1043628 RepID=W7HXB8_9PEZI|nr:hypothetical protein DRE_02258 [Drechslerella stenobrocha 248]